MLGDTCLDLRIVREMTDAELADFIWTIDDVVEPNIIQLIARQEALEEEKLRRNA